MLSALQRHMDMTRYNAVVYRTGTWAAIAAEHISYEGSLGRWVRIPTATGPVERFATWNQTQLKWEVA